MKFLVSVDIEGEREKLNKLTDFVYSEGVSREVLPDMLIQERIFTNMKTFYRFMSKCEELYRKPLRFCFQPLPVIETDNEDIVMLTIEKAKK